MPRRSVVEFDNVTKVYRSGLFGQRAIHALRGVSLTVEPGEVLALVGPNRAGKTTLVKILLSICHPTGGRVLRLGHTLRDRTTLARVGYMHENQAFPRYLTAQGLLDYYGALSMVLRADRRQRIATLLGRVGLDDRDQEPIWRFSKGMLQRLALAQALVNEPELLVLDEPSEGMDLCARQLIRNVVERQRAEGRSVILVSHSLAEVERMCDRVAVLREGKLAFLGPLAELLARRKAAEPQSLEQALEPLYASTSS